MENVVLPFHLAERVGPQPLQGTIQTMLSAPQEDFKHHKLSDLAWMLLRQQPTQDLFTVDRRGLQVIGGKIFGDCGAYLWFLLECADLVYYISSAIDYSTYTYYRLEKLV